MMTGTAVGGEFGIRVLVRHECELGTGDPPVHTMAQTPEPLDVSGVLDTGHA